MPKSKVLVKHSRLSKILLWLSIVYTLGVIAYFHENIVALFTTSFKIYSVL